MDSQQGDILLEQTVNDGEISVVNGVVTMTGSFETAAYLSLFGGNEDDDGRVENSAAWWGNLSEADPDFRYTSETQNLLQALPAVTSNLRKIKEAVKRDLAWFLNKGIASSVDVVVSVPALNRVQIIVNIRAEGDESTFTFIENWKAGVN